MSEAKTYLRTCACGTRFEPPIGTQRTTCRRCSGLVCPGCGGPTEGGALCSRPVCARKRKRLARAARPRLIRRAV